MDYFCQAPLGRPMAMAHDTPAPGDTPPAAPPLRSQTVRRTLAACRRTSVPGPHSTWLCRFPWTSLSTSAAGAVTAGARATAPVSRAHYTGQIWILASYALTKASASLMTSRCVACWSAVALGTCKEAVLDIAIVQVMEGGIVRWGRCPDTSTRRHTSLVSGAIHRMPSGALKSQAHHGCTALRQLPLTLPH
jgi:hypothetical protein